jgi:Protein of unknown function (DUF3309)
MVNVALPVAKYANQLRKYGVKIRAGGETFLLLMILVVVLLLALFGSLPSWPHSRNWGYYPSGGISLILLILLILFLMGRL